MYAALLRDAGFPTEMVSLFSTHFAAAFDTTRARDAVPPTAVARTEGEGGDSGGYTPLIFILLHLGQKDMAHDLLGRGNYVHLPEMYTLTRAAFGLDSITWSLFHRACALPQAAWGEVFQCDRESFDALCEIVQPWLDLPKYWSKDFFNGNDDVISLEDMQANSKVGRPYSQSSKDRLMSTFLMLRNGIDVNTAILTTLYSSASNSRHFEHGCWAFCKALRPWNRWPTPEERDAMYAVMPEGLRAYMASRGYDPRKICVFAAMDGGGTTLPGGVAPPNRSDYWCFKNKDENYANM